MPVTKPNKYDAAAIKFSLPFVVVVPFAIFYHLAIYTHLTTAQIFPSMANLGISKADRYSTIDETNILGFLHFQTVHYITPDFVRFEDFLILEDRRKLD